MPRCGLVEAFQQREDRALAGAGRPDDRGHATGRQREGQPPVHPVAAGRLGRVAEPDVVERERRPGPAGRRAGGLGRRLRRQRRAARCIRPTAASPACSWPAPVTRAVSGSDSSSR